MAKYKALQSFGVSVSMYVGEVKDLSDDTIVKDLLRAGFIEPIEPAKEVKAKAEKKGAKA